MEIDHALRMFVFGEQGLGQAMPHLVDDAALSPSFMNSGKKPTDTLARPVENMLVQISKYTTLSAG